MMQGARVFNLLLHSTPQAFAPSSATMGNNERQKLCLICVWPKGAGGSERLAAARSIPMESVEEILGLKGFLESA